MYYDVSLQAPQGWQCPVCGRVYSPTTPMCWYCNTDTTETSSTGNFKVSTPLKEDTFRYDNWVDTRSMTAADKAAKV